MSYCSLRITNLRRGAATLSAPYIDGRKEWIGRELALSAKERAARRDARREAERVDVFLRTARVAAICERVSVLNGAVSSRPLRRVRSSTERSARWYGAV